MRKYIQHEIKIMRKCRLQVTSVSFTAETFQHIWMLILVRTSESSVWNTEKSSGNGTLVKTNSIKLIIKMENSIWDVCVWIPVKISCKIVRGFISTYFQTDSNVLETKYSLNIQKHMNYPHIILSKYYQIIPSYLVNTFDKYSMNEEYL